MSLLVGDINGVLRHEWTEIGLSEQFFVSICSEAIMKRWRRKKRRSKRKGEKGKGTLILKRPWNLEKFRKKKSHFFQLDRQNLTNIMTHVYNVAMGVCATSLIWHRIMGFCATSHYALLYWFLRNDPFMASRDWFLRNDPIVASRKLYKKKWL